MKTSFTGWLNRLLSSLIALTAVTGCKCATNTQQEEPVCMYGAPTAYYTVRGTITNAQKEPLKGIQVQVSVSSPRDNELPLEERYFMEMQKYDYETQTSITTFSTDEEGKFEVQDQGGDIGGGTVKVVFSDPNHVYQTDSIYNDTPQEIQHGVWETEYEYTLDIQMKKGKSNNKKKK